ncbi:HNH endonuclease [Vibrio gazogenes]|uniref:Restriction endonuclease n=1 Tax=Vibrio gazogenes TaxID=687 RepID=A0A1Z2SH52_VIBGA|nr:HNH endonuclease [Vibrio gazogenes]ASA56519.1 restriction endonuclease [Vibrio gazogenes]
MSLEYYEDKFRNLNMNTKGNHKSPHKVCMLLAVTELIESGVIAANRIDLNEPLKEAFTRFFNQRRRDTDQNTPENPYFHLKSEGFWHIVYNPGIDPATVKRYSKTAVSHITIDDALFAYLQSRITNTDLKEALNHNLSDLAFLYQQWLVDIGQAPETVERYTRLIASDLSEWLQEQGLANIPVFDMKSYRAFHDLALRFKQSHALQVNDPNLNLFSAVIDSYQQFLKDLTQIDLQQDVAQIDADEHLTTTEKQILRNARLGQGTYRRQLIDLWQGCAVTRYRNTQMLVASHIKPWRDSNNDERLDKYNGLLLLANLDKAFDLGFISFDQHGKVMISKYLQSPATLGIREEMHCTLHREHRKYLDYHRVELFKGF